MDYYIEAFKKFGEFSGRTSRKAYWMFVLVNACITFLLGYMIPNLLPFYQVLIILPGLSMGVRRMHDTNHSGLFIIIPVVNLILTLTAGDKKKNQYGSAPKR